jgi:hypothetical protein
MAVVKNKRGWKRFCRKNLVQYASEPKSYPCVIDERFDNQEDTYLRYYYFRDIEKLRNKLIKMGALKVKKKPVQVEMFRGV